MDSTPTVVCVGETMAVLLPERPGPLEDVPSFRHSCGGAEANVARGLVALGVPAAWAGRVGADGFGRRVLRELAGRRRRRPRRHDRPRPPHRPVREGGRAVRQRPALLPGRLRGLGDRPRPARRPAVRGRAARPPVRDHGRPLGFRARPHPRTPRAPARPPGQLRPELAARALAAPRPGRPAPPPRRRRHRHARRRRGRRRPRHRRPGRAARAPARTVHARHQGRRPPGDRGHRRRHRHRTRAERRGRRAGRGGGRLRRRIPGRYAARVRPAAPPAARPSAAAATLVVPGDHGPPPPPDLVEALLAASPDAWAGTTVRATGITRPVEETTS